MSHGACNTGFCYIRPMVFFRGLNQRKADRQFFNTSIANLKGVVKKRQKLAKCKLEFLIRFLWQREVPYQLILISIYFN